MRRLQRRGLSDRDAKAIVAARTIPFHSVADLIIHARTWQQYELPARRASALIATGRLERKGEVVHILVCSLEDLDSRGQRLAHRSRDFR